VGAGDMLAAPKMLTRSSSGFVDVPLRRLFAAAVCDVDGWLAAVAASPARPEMLESTPPVEDEEGSSSKSRRFSVCWPATRVSMAFLREVVSSSTRLEIKAVSYLRQRLGANVNILSLANSVGTDTSSTDECAGGFVVYTCKR
jgi:hypothetical protein